MLQGFSFFNFNFTQLAARPGAAAKIKYRNVNP